MAFVVEDGTGKTNSNSYGAVSGADAYFEDRGNAAWLSLADTVKEQCLVQATDYIDMRYGFRFLGEPTTTTQALEWPRKDTGKFGDNEIPSDLKYATYEYAVRASKGPLAPDPVIPASGVPTVVTMEKVGELQREYEPVGGSYANLALVRPYPGADIWLQNLLKRGYGGGDRVIR